MRSLVNWKDMVCEFPNRFAQTVEGDKVTLQRSPGTVRTQELRRMQLILIQWIWLRWKLC